MKAPPSPKRVAAEQRGRQGEWLAEAYLAREGWEILARRDGDHILRRPAELRADRIVIAVEPEFRRGQSGHHKCSHVCTVRRDHRGGRQGFCHFMREIWPAQHRMCRIWRHLRDDFQRQAMRADLNTLGAIHQDQAGRQLGQHSAQML